jgi:hypothetical protein
MRPDDLQRLKVNTKFGKNQLTYYKAGRDTQTDRQTDRQKCYPISLVHKLCLNADNSVPSMIQ